MRGSLDAKNAGIFSDSGGRSLRGSLDAKNAGIFSDSSGPPLRGSLDAKNAYILSDNGGLSSRGSLTRILGKSGNFGTENQDGKERENLLCPPIIWRIALNFGRKRIFLVLGAGSAISFLRTR